MRRVKLERVDAFDFCLIQMTQRRYEFGDSVHKLLRKSRLPQMHKRKVWSKFIGEFELNAKALAFKRAQRIVNRCEMMICARNPSKHQP